MKVKAQLYSVLLLAVLAVTGTRASAQTAPAGPMTVEYGVADQQSLGMDIYGADAKQTRPGLILLHGGGWAAGNRSDMALPAQALTQQGYVCFAVSYRLVKEGKNQYPAQIDDVQRAVRWIRAHAADYGVDPNRIGAIGFSAGGHLVALLGTMDTRDNSIPELKDYSSRVQCVVDFYGPSDLTAADQDPAGEVELRKQLVQNFLGKWPENEANYREASPITHVDKKSAPFLLIHGAKDTLVPVAQSQVLDEALRKAGVESQLIVLPNVGHGFGDPESIGISFAAAVAFLAKHLK